MPNSHQYEADMKELEDSFSLGKILCIFCCPPFPSSIANKMAFVKLSPSYEFQHDHNNDRLVLRLNSRADSCMSDGCLDDVQCHMIKTKKKVSIACVYIRPRHKKSASFTLLLSHGNGVDIGRCIGYIQQLATVLNVNILMYDYCGYGVSSGKASEKNSFYDILAAYELLLDSYHVSPHRIVLYGQSIGSVPTVELASKIKCAGVVIHSGLASGMQMVFPRIKPISCLDVFRNSSKMCRVSSPTLIIHGKLDDIVPFPHGMSLYENALNPVPPLWLSNAGHNDCESFPEYFRRLKQFLQEDIHGPHILDDSYSVS